MSADLTPIPSVDRVRTEAQERLDKPDFDGVMSLVDEAVGRSLGALLGYGSGVTSPPSVDASGVTSSAPQFLRIGSFQYYVSVPTWSDDGLTFRGWRGSFVTFDASASGQNTYLDISAAYANRTDPVAGQPGIYAKPLMLDMDTDGRRKWQSTADAAVSMKTRSRIRTLLRLSTDTPEHSSNTGWALVGQLGWSGTTPTISWRSWMDNALAEAHAVDENSSLVSGLESFKVAESTNVKLLDALVTGTTLVDAVNGGKVFAGAGTQRDMGLIQTLTLLRQRLARILANSTDDAVLSVWWSNPAATIATLNARTKAAPLVFSGLVDFAAGVYSLGPSSRPSTDWEIVVDPSGPHAGYTDLQVVGPAGVAFSVISVLAVPAIDTLGDRSQRTVQVQVLDGAFKGGIAYHQSAGSSADGKFTYLITVVLT